MVFWVVAPCSYVVRNYVSEAVLPPFSGLRFVIMGPTT